MALLALPMADTGVGRLAMCSPTRPIGADQGSLRVIRGVRPVGPAAGAALDRAHDAAVTLSWYPAERENRTGNGPARVEMGDQELASVPVGETRIWPSSDDDSQQLRVSSRNGDSRHTPRRAM